MAFERNVFVNCPFDPQYLPLLRPLLFTIIYLGLKPRLTDEGFSPPDIETLPVSELIDRMERWVVLSQ